MARCEASCPVAHHDVVHDRPRLGEHDVAVADDRRLPELVDLAHLGRRAEGWIALVTHDLVIERELLE